MNFVQQRRRHDNRPAIVRHCWGRGVKTTPPLDLDEWSDLLEGRRTFMPVRDPAQMAHSWVNAHGRALSMLTDALHHAVTLLRNLPIERVDIRGLSDNYRRGNHGRDEIAGARLRDAYPEYYGGIY